MTDLEPRLPVSKPRAEFLREMAEQQSAAIYAPLSLERQRAQDGRCLRCGGELSMWERLRRYLICLGCHGEDA